MLTRSNKDHNGHNTYYGLDNQNIAKLSILSSPKLKNIDSVNLSCTSLRTVNFEGFTNFEHITEVNLSENFIQNVDFTLVKLRYLKSINLSNNLINTLSPQVSSDCNTGCFLIMRDDRGHLVEELLL